MGQAQLAKFERRQIRRVVGDDVPRLMQGFAQRIAETDRKVQALASAVGQEGAYTNTRLAALASWRMRGFWGRLNWLLTGR